MSENNAWNAIGTVVGNASTHEYSFVLRSFRSRVGDLVAVKMDVPDDSRTGTMSIVVWGRVIGINRYNPFFPYEAAQELSNEGLSPYDTILSTSRDQLEAQVTILGYTADAGQFQDLHPLTYPVQPAAEVLYPPATAINGLLAGGSGRDQPLLIGSLIARQDVHITISADRVVSRHMAILAMTGGGKTVAARRILRELIDIGYPLLILDPHGDYLGIWERRSLFPETQVNLLYPHIAMTEENRHIVEVLINKMTQGLTEPQKEELNGVLADCDPRSGESVLQYIKRLKEALVRRSADKIDRRKVPTLMVCKRQLSTVETRLERMELTNERMRRRLKSLDFSRMADPQGRPEAIIAPYTVSILYLGGYDHLTQTTIASILLEALYEHRANLSNRIPPFLALIEEAHTFIPSTREGVGDVPSLETIRKLITEGRKFGTGLLLITQRPSRVDETILSQCNSFLILRLVNPRDQSYVRQIMENLSEQDARMLPGFGPGQGIISGQAVRFPLLVRILMDKDLVYSDLGNENFFEQAREWKPDEFATVRERAASNLKTINKLPPRRRGRKSNDDKRISPSSRMKSSDLPQRSDKERWNSVRRKVTNDQRTIGELEAITGANMPKKMRSMKLAVIAGHTWDKLADLYGPRARNKVLKLLESALKIG